MRKYKNKKKSRSHGVLAKYGNKDQCYERTEVTINFFPKCQKILESSHFSYPTPSIKIGENR